MDAKPVGTVGHLMSDAEHQMSGDLVRCAGCGVRGRWVGTSVVNAESRSVPALCSQRPLRAHGPWLPEEVDQ